MSLWRHKLAGLSLVELIVASGLTIVVASVVLSLVVGGNQAFANINLRQTRASSMLDAFKRMSDNARIAAEFPASVVIDGVTYTAGIHTLILKLYSIDSNGKIVCGLIPGNQPYDIIVYTSANPAAGTPLLEFIDPDPNGSSSRPKVSNRVVVPKIDILNFTQTKSGPTDHRKVTILLGQMGDSGPDRGVVKQFTKDVVARND